MQCLALSDGRWQQARPRILFRKFFGTDGQVAPEAAGGVGSAAAKSQRIRTEEAQIDKARPARLGLLDESYIDTVDRLQ